MEAHSANILRKSGRGASRERIFYVRAAAHPGRGGICSGRGGPLGAARAGVDPLFRRGRHRAAAVSGRAGRIPVRSPFSGGAGIGPVRAVGSGEGRHGVPVPDGAGMEPPPFPDGAGRIPVRSSCSGGAGIGSVRTVGSDEGWCGASVPAWNSCPGRAGRIPRTQGLPSLRTVPSGRGPMLRFRTLFVLFCSVPPRLNRRRLQIRGFAAREKRKSCFFIFTL